MGQAIAAVHEGQPSAQETTTLPLITIVHHLTLICRALGIDLRASNAPPSTQQGALYGVTGRQKHMVSDPTIVTTPGDSENVIMQRLMTKEVRENYLLPSDKGDDVRRLVPF